VQLDAMARSEPTILTNPHIPALDGLRGIAIFLVLTYHFGLLRFGWLGVGLFFTLSGFLITEILLETKSLPIRQYLGRFYWRRILRIFPLYFGFILLVTLVFLLTGRPTGVAEQLPWLSTFSYNFYMGLEHQAGLQQVFHVLWSISTEEQFYLVWPLVVFLMPRKVLVVIAIGLIVAAPLIRYLEPEIVRSLGIEVVSDGKLIYYFPFGQVDAFAIGTLFALAKKAPWIRKPQTWGLLLMVPALFVILRQFYLSLGPNGVPFPIHLGFPVSSTLDGFHIWGYTAGYLAFGGLLIILLFGSPRLWARKFVESNAARWFGKFSFGLYVFHWPLLLAMELIWPLSENLGLRLVQFCAYTTLLSAIAWLSYTYFESWFLGKKDAFFKYKSQFTPR
jgi:peptidoglycan/LPS O-acetylase OafA/YrhL